MSADTVESGVNPFEGAFGRSWYGWASRGHIYKEGGVRRFKFLARLDARRLASQLQKGG